jgi:hypothetical protein
LAARLLQWLVDCLVPGSAAGLRGNCRLNLDRIRDLRESIGRLVAERTSGRRTRSLAMPALYHLAKRVVIGRIMLLIFGLPYPIEPVK